MANVMQEIEGRAPDGEYRFVRTSFTDNAIEHGWIILQPTINIVDPERREFNVDASFLYFKDLIDATNVHHNLLRLKGESFLRSYFVIKRKEGIWVAVEKIDQTLEEYRNSNNFSWKDSTNRPNRLPPNYQNIIRDIIKGMCLLHQQNYCHGDLSSKTIMIIKDRAKLAFIRHNSIDHEADDFEKLRTVFTQVLRTAIFHDELTHFHASASINHWMLLRRLYFHPLLMSSGERFLLPVRADTRLRYRRVGVETLKLQYATRFCTGLRWKFEVEINQQYGYVLESPRGPGYQDFSWDQFKFVRNATIHINEYMREQHLAIKRETDVENDFTLMFPNFLSRMYDFLELEEISPSVRLHFGEI